MIYREAGSFRKVSRAGTIEQAGEAYKDSRMRIP
jgi:hypothetical protein